MGAAAVIKGISTPKRVWGCSLCCWSNAHPGVCCRVLRAVLEEWAVVALISSWGGLGDPDGASPLLRASPTRTHAGSKWG